MSTLAVIIPCYNAGSFLEVAVSSAIAQPEVTEILICDDGSTDQSRMVARAMERRDSRVRLLTNPDGRNLGVSAARNKGIFTTHCDLIAFLDADDFFFERRFEVALDTLRDEQVSAVYETMQCVFEDEAARTRWFSRYRSDLYGMNTALSGLPLFEALIVGTHGHFGTNAVVARRSFILDLGGFDESLRSAQDTLLWLRMAACGTLVPGDQGRPISARRIHDGNRFFVSKDEKRTLGLLVLERLLQWLRTIACDHQYIQIVNSRIAFLSEASRS